MYSAAVFFRNSDVIGDINIAIDKMFILILCEEPMAGNNCLKPDIYHYQDSVSS